MADSGHIPVDTLLVVDDAVRDIPNRAVAFVNEDGLPWTPGGVTSVNGDAGPAVVLTASDLGATTVGQAVFVAADQAAALTAIGALSATGTAVSATSADLALACSGNAATATQWVGGRTITLSGAVSGVSPAWTGSGNLAFSGTTLTAATTSVRGGVLQSAAQADSVATDAPGIVTDFNALLAKLRTAGLLST